jgi:hypothetical protein
MKLTIIPIDNAVYVDNYSYSGLNLSSANIPSNVHALQWKNTTGWIEFIDNDDGTKPQNQSITELPDWANACVVKWNEAKAAKEEADAQAAQNQPVTQGTQTL